MAKGIKVTGDEEVRRGLRRMSKAFPAAAAKALWTEGIALDAEMVQRIPVDTGRLRSTHYAAPPERDARGLHVEVGVGTAYALPVHERTEVAHVTGEAKYLANALAVRAHGFLARLGARMRRTGWRV